MTGPWFAALLRMDRESWAVAFGSCSGMALGTLLACIYGPTYFVAAAFGVFALVTLVIGVTRPESTNSQSRDHE